MAENGNGANGGTAGSDDFSFDDNSGTSAANGKRTGESAGIVDPASLKPASGTGGGTGGGGGGTDAGTTAPKRGRGRPKGSGNKPAAASTQSHLDLGFVELVLTSINAGIVALTHIPEMEVSAEENKRIAQALQNVAQYYPVYVNPKTQAWIALGTVAAQVYGTRAIAIALRSKAEEKKDEPQPAPVHSIVSGVAPFPMQNR